MEHKWNNHATDVDMLLHGLNQSQYTNLFEEQGITLDILLTLNFEDMKVIGIENEEDCLSLVEGIKNFAKKSTNYTHEELDLTFSQEDALALCKNTLKQLSLLHAALAHTRLRLKRVDARNKLVQKQTTARVLELLCKEAQMQSDILMKRIVTLHPNLEKQKSTKGKLLKIFTTVVSVSAVAVIVSVYRNYSH